MTSPPPADKACAACGRRIAWRARWRATWDQVRWCSDACRATGRGAARAAARADLEAAIIAALAARAHDATLCPSEVARAVGGDDEARWRPLMEPVRMAARRLVARGELEIVQRGHVVDPSTARGPIRLRRPRA